MTFAEVDRRVWAIVLRTGHLIGDGFDDVAAVEMHDLIIALIYDSRKP